MVRAVPGMWYALALCATRVDLAGVVAPEVALTLRGGGSPRAPCGEGGRAPEVGPSDRGVVPSPAPARVVAGLVGGRGPG